METLVSVDDLAAHLDDPSWRIFDCRFALSDPAAGQRAYHDAHIPSAARADIDEHLSGVPVPGQTGRHPLPDRRAWIERVRGWGLQPELQVVVYDDAGGAFAARMWWMLRWAGHRNVAVLDGGWQAWIARNLPVTAAAPPPPRPSSADYDEREPLTRLIQADDIDAAAQRLLDARDPARFRGEVEPIDPVAGHIPGAACSPSSANLDESGYFKSAAELRAKFAAAIGESGRAPVVCYCGSGITAAHNVLALVYAGFDEPFLYAGSWSEWITDPRRPIETGD